MSDLFNVGTKALLSFQKAIQVTGNNITNVKTEGFSRQVMHFDSRPSTPYGGFYIGNGVEISSVERMSDLLSNQRLRDSTSIYNAYAAFNANTAELNSLLSSNEASLSNSIQSFYSSLQNVVDTPDSIPARQAFLSSADSLVERFHQVDANLNYQVDLLNNDLGLQVNRINTIASQLAQVNANTLSNAEDNPDIMNTRDVLLRELSGLIDISVTFGSDNSMTVSVGKGQPLVCGVETMQLAMQSSSTSPRSNNIVVMNRGTSIDITDSIQGGQLGGLLAFRDEVISPVQNGISRLALSISDHVNQQHEMGMDLKNQLGSEFFSDINSVYLSQRRAGSNTNNVGNAQFSVDISNTDQLTASDYRISVGSGPSYQIKRLSDDAVYPISSFPFAIDGMVIQLDSGTASPGDSFFISPTANAASQMTLEISNANEIALASPIRTQSSMSNTGNGAISAGTVVDIANSSFTATPQALNPPVTIQFLSATTYQLVNANTSAVIEGPVTYNPAVSNSVFPTPGSYDPGYRIEISGQPKAGDTFSISYNTGGRGDSRNALALVAQQTTKYLNNGTTSYQAAYGELVTDVGIRHDKSQVDMKTSGAICDQAIERVANLSGVNLDEELSNLLEYEQAYQAASHIISVANSLFDTILSIFR